MALPPQEEINALRQTVSAGPSLAEVIVQDPLNAVTRKERLYLLAVSMIGTAMVGTGLVPTKIAQFGVELSEPKRDALLALLAFVTIYFLVAFSIYAASDFVARREAIQAARERDAARTILQSYGIGIADESARPREVAEGEPPSYNTPVILARRAPRLVAAIRVVFEFVLPILVGLFATYVLLARVLGWVSIFPPP